MKGPVTDLLNGNEGEVPTRWQWPDIWPTLPSHTDDSIVANLEVQCQLVKSPDLRAYRLTSHCKTAEQVIHGMVKTLPND